MQTNFLSILILVGGILLLFLGLAPIFSSRYFEKVYKNTWQTKLENISEKEGKSDYLYAKYTRQIFPLLMGMTLFVYAIYQLFLK